MDAIAFLSGVLPPAEEGSGWEHMSCSACQMGCEALVALGHAEETEWGAVPREPAQLPSVLPRWDDICIAVLGLAEQHSRLAYHNPDGSGPPYVIVMRGRGDMKPPRITPNINAIDGLGLAYASPEALSALRSLGLVAEGRWTEDAETVLWREQPSAWGIDFTSDPRFAAAVEQAVDTVPDDIRAEMDRAVTISDADVSTYVARSEAWHKRERAIFGPKAQIGRPHTAEQARRGLEGGCRNNLNWLFFRRWRLPDGWLAPEEAERALEIFLDSLAIEMRRAVAPRLYPDLPFLADHH